MALPGAWGVGLIAGQLLTVPVAWAECGPVEDETQTTYRQVRWEDFQGEPPGRFGGHYRSRVERARIATAIRLEPVEFETTRDDTGRWLARPANVCVRALMYKDRSSVRPHEQTDRGLRHEQGHFDLTAYFASVLRSPLSALEHRADSPEDAERGLWEQIERDYNAVVERWKEMEARYDRETRHNGSRPAQDRWLREIGGLVSAIEPAADSRFTLIAMESPLLR